MQSAPIPFPTPDTPSPAEPVIVVVTGAHPRAEQRDRPLAYTLADRVRLHTNDGGVLVCSDLWYLNDEALRAKPTISIGGPSVNALTAFLADKVPSALAVDNTMMVQLDVQLHDLVACCWGVDQETTRSACEAFAQRYLAAFVETSLRRMAT